MVVCPYNGTLPKSLRKILMHLSERTLELFYSVKSKNAIFCAKKKGGGIVIHSHILQHLSIRFD